VLELEQPTAAQQEKIARQIRAPEVAGAEADLLAAARGGGAVFLEELVELDPEFFHDVLRV
jgi:hypothetical protein